jgi:hypothetical protein
MNAVVMMTFVNTPGAATPASPMIAATAMMTISSDSTSSIVRLRIDERSLDESPAVR